MVASLAAALIVLVAAAPWSPLTAMTAMGYGLVIISLSPLPLKMRSNDRRKGKEDI